MVKATTTTTASSLLREDEFFKIGFESTVHMTSMRAAAIGFVAGSIVTTVLWITTTWWRKSQKEDDDPEGDGEEEHVKLQRLSKSSASRRSILQASKQASTFNKDLAAAGLSMAVSSSFLTDLVQELWQYLNVAGSEKIRAAVEPSFAESLPAPLNSLRFTKIDLGTNPIRMDNLKVKQITKDGMVQVVMDMVWNGTCDIQLQADSYIGGLAFGVKNIKLSGPFSLWFRPLTNALPVIAGIQYAFVNPPYLELKFTGLAAVADMTYIDKAVRGVIASSLLCVVLPNKGLYKMQAACNYLDAYQPPLGICTVTAVKGRGFVIERKLIAKDDIPDVYLNVTLGTSKVWKTITIHDNLSPVFNEAHDFLLWDAGQKLFIHAWDEDKGPLDPDDDLGYATALVEEILIQPNRQLELELLNTSTQKSMDAFVTMQCDILRWTTDLSSLNNTSATASVDVTNKSDTKIIQPPPQQILGLLVVIINQGFNLPVERKQAASFVKMMYDGQEYQTKQIVDYDGVDALNPLYESAFEIPIRKGMPLTTKEGDKKNAKIVLQLFNTTMAPADAKGQKGPQDVLLGSFDIDLNVLRDNANVNHTITERKPIGSGGASINYRVSLSGVERTTSKTKTNLRHQPGTSPAKTLPASPRKRNLDYGIVDNELQEELMDISIGTVRLSVICGRGLTIQQELFNIDVPDAYCTIQFGSSTDIWKTSVQRNTCTPEWNESKEYPLQDHAQIVSLELWDENERSFDPDVFVGRAKTTVGNLLLAGGSLDLELQRPQQKGGGLFPTGVYVTLRCNMVE